MIAVASVSLPLPVPRVVASMPPSGAGVVDVARARRGSVGTRATLLDGLRGEREVARDLEQLIGALGVCLRGRFGNQAQTPGSAAIVVAPHTTPRHVSRWRIVPSARSKGFRSPTRTQSRAIRHEPPPPGQRDPDGRAWTHRCRARRTSPTGGERESFAQRRENRHRFRIVRAFGARGTVPIVLEAAPHDPNEHAAAVEYLPCLPTRLRSRHRQRALQLWLDLDDRPLAGFSRNQSASCDQAPAHGDADEAFDVILVKVSAASAPPLSSRTARSRVETSSRRSASRAG